MTKTLAEQLRDPFLWERDNVEIRSQAADEIVALTKERHQLRNELTAARLEGERLRNIVNGCPVCSELERNIKRPDEPVSAPVEYVLEQRCKCGLIWRVHAEYSFRVNQIFCACGKKIYIDRDAVKSAPEPSDGYSQAYADQMRTALLHISKPVFLNLKPAYADPDNVKAICDGLNERIKLAQEALLPPEKSAPEPDPLSALSITEEELNAALLPVAKHMNAQLKQYWAMPPKEFAELAWNTLLDEMGAEQTDVLYALCARLSPEWEQDAEEGAKIDPTPQKSECAHSDPRPWETETMAGMFCADCGRNFDLVTKPQP